MEAVRPRVQGFLAQEGIGFRRHGGIIDARHGLVHA